jgi:hypothetical protein
MLNKLLKTYFTDYAASIPQNCRRFSQQQQPVLGKDLSNVIKEKRTLSAECRNAFSDQRSHPVTKKRCTIWFNAKLLQPQQQLPAAESHPERNARPHHCISSSHFCY